MSSSSRTAVVAFVSGAGFYGGLAGFLALSRRLTAEGTSWDDYGSWIAVAGAIAFARIVGASAARLVHAPLWVIPIGIVLGIVVGYLLFAFVFFWFLYDPQ